MTVLTTSDPQLRLHSRLLAAPLTSDSHLISTFCEQVSSETVQLFSWCSNHISTQSHPPCKGHYGTHRRQAGLAKITATYNLLGDSRHTERWITPQCNRRGETEKAKKRKKSSEALHRQVPCCDGEERVLWPSDRGRRIAVGRKWWCLHSRRTEAKSTKKCYTFSFYHICFLLLSWLSVLQIKV